MYESVGWKERPRNPALSVARLHHGCLISVLSIPLLGNLEKPTAQAALELVRLASLQNSFAPAHCHCAQFRKFLQKIEQAFFYIKCYRPIIK